MSIQHSDLTPERSYLVEALIDPTNALRGRDPSDLAAVFDVASRIFNTSFGERWTGITTFGIYDPETAEPLSRADGVVLALFVATYREPVRGAATVVSRQREVVLAPVF